MQILSEAHLIPNINTFQFSEFAMKTLPPRTSCPSLLPPAPGPCGRVWDPNRAAAASDAVSDEGESVVVEIQGRE